ncbi:MAG: GGDEF domain-containing protein [Deltaproteobacteria bacterium]|nr:MAG: GGDEF domain-containing protein [Deltaproteobacteria bacterium]
MPPKDDDHSMLDEGDTSVFAVRIRPAGSRSERHLLVCTEGSQLGRVVRLGVDPLTVGRSPKSGLHLADSGVSRQHAEIRPFGAHYVLADEGSANGTFVHDRQIETHLLQDGDVIAFGSSATFRYSIADEQQERMLRALYDATQTDKLTGVGNRHAFDQQLANGISHAKREGRSLSLLLIDVDHFKAVNDTWGHATGDEALREIAQRLREALRAEDLLCRYGGEEFAALLTSASPSQVRQVAERLRAAIEAAPFTTRGLELTVSIGSASYAEQEQDLVELADQRLYAAKASGRNRVVSE